MWKLSIADDQANTTVVNLTRDEYTVGRAEDSTVRLTERNISRRHARLYKNGEGWVIEDLDSYNGCFVNGTRIGGAHRLEHGDLIQLGDYRLEVMDEAVAGVPQGKNATIPAVPKSQALLGQPDRLVMLVGPTPGLEFPLTEDTLTLGRGEECQISINHSSVSRVHAEIRPAGRGRYEILDKNSANGVRINGVELQRGLVDARDNVELGDVVLKFIPAGQIYKPGADESQQIDAISPAALERISPLPGLETPAPTGIPAALKVVLAVVGLGVLVVLGMLTLGGKSDANDDSSTTTQATVDPAAQALEEAKELLKQNDLEGAHKRATEGIPESSNARQSPDFREIEAKWADSLFDKAAAETDPTKRREILDRIAKATSVDSTRRKRAVNEIAKLDGDGVDINELPAVPKPDTSAGAPSAPTSSGGLVRKNPFGESTAKPTPTEKPAATSNGSAIDDAASGDREKKTRAKAALLAKANSGTATKQDLRVLRALCRQLGDGGCVAKASAMLASAPE
ncbi:MAG: FHA domain-containing protein [Polyangiaceae bacterium]|nr:FHA domain-containing protein [Polyangiaceae bacterium]MCB9605269.1 FHA domain-containing protein [Polyangiaceae bacterium]